MLDTIGEKPAGEFLRSIRLSAHAGIHPDGTIEEWQDIDRVAYHAGKSEWNGITSLNFSFLGIELLIDISQWWNQIPEEVQNRGEYDCFMYIIDNVDWVQAKQLDSLIWLIRHWEKETSTTFDESNIIGHNQCSPDRKKDPGLEFPWDLFWKYY